MHLVIQVVHRDLEESYSDRFKLVNSLKQFGAVNIAASLSDEPSFSFQPNCLIVHETQYDDVNRAKTFCAQLGHDTRLIIFGGTADLFPLDNYGYSVPESIFAANVVPFFAEWYNLSSFPGWDFLVGEPELEYALQLLHGLLPGVYSEPTEDVSKEWQKLESLKKRYVGAIKEVDLESIWGKASTAYDLCLSNPSSSESKRLLENLRDTLLGDSPRTSVGLVPALTQSRK